MAARACPGAAAGSKWPLELAPEPQNARKVLLKPGPEPHNAREVLLEPGPEPQHARIMPLEPAPELQNARKVSLEPAPEPQQARKVPLEPTAVRCVRFLRSKSAVFCSSVIGLHFCSAPLCSVGLGLAGAFDLDARALLASLRPRPGRAERKRTDLDKPSLPGDASQGRAMDACCTPSPLGLAGALELAARARLASVGRSTGQSLTKTNRTRQATDGDRPSLLGDASLGRTTDSCGTQHRDERTPCTECTGTH